VLKQARVLVAEDEPFIALTLALAIEDAGGVVVGPVGTVREAMALLQSGRVSAAILDVNLADGDVFPVLELLIGLGKPLIVQSAVGLPARFSDRLPPNVIHTKPWVAEALVAHLGRLISERRSEVSNKPSVRSAAPDL